MLLVYFVIAAIPIGYLAGGSLHNIRYARLRFVILPCAAFLLEASFGLINLLVDGPPSQWLGKAVCIEYLLLTLFIWINHRMRGMDILGAATLLNFIVISANGYRMPVTPVIYDHPELYHFVERIQNGALPEYVLVDWNAPFWFLGDTLPLGKGLASIGDLLMAAGIMILIITMMKAKRPHRKRYHYKNHYSDRYYRSGRYHRSNRYHRRTRWN